MSNIETIDYNNVVSTTHDLPYFVLRAKRRRSKYRRQNCFAVKERLQQKLAGKKKDHPEQEYIEEIFKAYRDHFGHDIISSENVEVVPEIGDKQHVFWLQLEKQQQEIIQSQVGEKTNPPTLDVKKAMTKLIFIQNILMNWMRFEKLM
jgi:hypothetical protein